MKPLKKAGMCLQPAHRSRVQIEHDLDLTLAKIYVELDSEYLSLYKRKVMLRSDRILKTELRQLCMYLGIQALQSKSFAEIHRKVREMKFGK